MAGPDVPGEERMWRLTARFPEQLQDGLKSVPRHNFAEGDRGPVAVVGMGGSGIAGDLLATAAARTGGAHLAAVRDFQLPGWARHPASSVLVSYSGGTAETLAAYDEAARRALPRAVITSGGALLARAKRDGVLTVQVPPGQPPRASLGYLVGALAGVLRHALPGVARDLPREAEALSTRGVELTDAQGEAAGLATAWGPDADLWVYAAEPLAPVARRWKTQAEENAKRLGHFDTVPELLHNAIVGWDALTEERAARRFVVVLRGRSEPGELAARLDYLERALRAKGARVASVTTRARSVLGELLDLCWTSDYVSLWRARMDGVDPLPVPGIDRMKSELGGAAGTRSS